LMLLGAISSRLGGEIGTMISHPLSKIITPVGSFITALTITCMSIVVIFDTPLENVLQKIHTLATALRQRIQTFQKKKESVLPPTEQTASEPTAVVETVINNRGNKPTIEIIDDQQQEATTHQHATRAIGSTPRSLDIVEEIPYSPPPLSLLSDPKDVSTDYPSIEKNAQVIERTLNNFGIQARIAEVNVGPSVTQYAIDLAEGTRSSKITSLQNDLALALASPTGSVRIEAPIPGKRLVGIEVPNMNLALVTLKEMLNSPEMINNPSKLAVALGEDVTGKPVISDIKKWPHILVAGSTGSGKSALIHSIINSILFRATPKEVSFIMVDPKRVELTQYNGTPHLQTPVIVDPDKTVSAFKWAVEEMEKRYRLFQQLSVRNLDDFNEKTDTEILPYIIIIVDELADLMAFAANEMESLITRIAQKARATGIYMVLSTQRPSVDVITGLIKANVPARIALNVSSGTDSRVILDTVGAEKLLGKGDMFFLPPDAGKPRRIQGVYVTDAEIESVTEYMKKFSPTYQKTTAQHSTSGMEPQELMTGNPISGMMEDTTEDSLQPSFVEPDDSKFLEAVEVIVNHQKASASLLQRRLKIGYARAARMLDELEEKGFVGPQDGSNPRDVHEEIAKQYLLKYKGQEYS
ncbi:DNA translocase FtsK, partial [candidate division WWE3 bacterium CG_4_9_14_3_um_filter_41_6]